MIFNPPKEEKNIQPFFRISIFQIFRSHVKMSAAERMVDFSRKLFSIKMLNRIWTLSCRKRLC